VLLNVTWKLMIHFLASTDSVGLEWLLEWVRVNTAGYPGVVVESWQSASLSNGRAFCALLHRFDPTVLDFDALPETDAEGASRAALEIAFETAATKFGAPMLLDAADVVGPASRASPTEGLDVKCMQALMLQLRQALRKCAEQRTKEAAILAERFTEDAAALVTWAREAEVALAGHSASAARLDRSDLSSGSSSVIEADKMLSELVQTFRGVGKEGVTSKRAALVERRLAALKATFAANAAAEKRFSHDVSSSGGFRLGDSMADNAKAREADRSAVEAQVAAQVAALTDSLAVLESAWASMEKVESAYEEALWSVLVEKKTDLMITAATKEAGALTKLASTWGDKASEEPILGFREENIDQSIAQAAAGAGKGGTNKAEMDAMASLPTALASGASCLCSGRAVRRGSKAWSDDGRRVNRRWRWPSSGEHTRGEGRLPTRRSSCSGIGER